MTIITLVIICVVFALMLTGVIDAIYIIPILGAYCIVMGVVVLVRGARNEAGLRTSDKQKAVIFVILGIILVALGVIQILGIEFSETVWNGIMAVALVLVVTYFVIRITKR